MATLEPGTGRNNRGAILVHNAPAAYWSANPPMMTPQLVVSSEQYNRIVRLVEGKVPVRLELNVQNRFVGDTLDAFNVVAELPGTDKAAEVVMLGAHFDSWHAGTGAVDNAAGSAAMMEAMRILKATGLRLRRTVRLVLWTGEEQGRLGSQAYVKEHFGDPRHHDAQARTRARVGLLQHGQRRRHDPRRLPRRQRGGAAHLHRVDGTVPQPSA